jgi:hypothetical protein
MFGNLGAGQRHVCATTETTLAALQHGSQVIVSEHFRAYMSRSSGLRDGFGEQLTANPPASPHRLFPFIVPRR